MRSDPTFKNFIDGEDYNYLDCVKIESTELISKDTIDYNIFDDEFTDAKYNISIYYRYI